VGVSLGEVEGAESPSRMRSLIPALGLLIGISCEPYSAYPPPPERWASDSVGLLSPATLGALDRKLGQYQLQSGHSVLVYVTDSSHGIPHDEWATTVYNRWTVGRKGLDDGAVLFVFTEDRYRWLAVGYGFERALPDRECARICRSIVKPAMEAGNPDAGITAGVDAILTAIERWDAAKAETSGVSAYVSP